MYKIIYFLSYLITIVHWNQKINLVGQYFADYHNGLKLFMSIFFILRLRLEHLMKQFLLVRLSFCGDNDFLILNDVIN